MNRTTKTGDQAAHDGSGLCPVAVVTLTCGREQRGHGPDEAAALCDEGDQNVHQQRAAEERESVLAKADRTEGH